MRKVKRDKLGRFIKGEKQWGKRPEIRKWLGKFEFKKGHKPQKPFKKGQHVSPETEFKKGHIPWSKGTKGIMKAWNKGKHIFVGEKNPMWGKHHSKESKIKIRNAKLGKKNPKLSKILKGRIPWNKNKTNIYSEETLAKMSESKKGKYKGEKSHLWRGGISKKGYIYLEFNKELKEEIRKRDNYECQYCYKKQEELKQKLGVHHIDYNKKNNKSINLISLCRKCHSKTNYNRNHWKKHFQMQMFIKNLFDPRTILIFNENKQLIGLK